MSFNFEHKSEAVLPFKLWLVRVAKSFGLASLIVVCSLVIGVLGYHFLGNLSLIDAILEACMILGGMGPVAQMNNDAVKLFASAYALYSGLMLLSLMGVLLAPWLHRMMHEFHTDKPVAAGRTKRRR